MGSCQDSLRITKHPGIEIWAGDNDEISYIAEPPRKVLALALSLYATRPPHMPLLLLLLLAVCNWAYAR